MIIKPIYLSSSLYRCISTHIKETEHLYVRFGIKNGAFLKDICPYKRSIKYFSSTPLRLNSEGETESKQTLNPTMDILKNAMSKAVILNTFENRNLIKQETVIPSISPTLNSEAKIKTTDGVQNKPLMNPDTIIDHIQYGPVQKETALLSPVLFHSSNNPKNGNFKGKEPPKSKDTAKAVKKKVRVDLSVASMERNFITPARAISDFLLKPQDMESLKATKRRSPYENEPPITVYWRKDVEAKAIEVWGTKENLQKELFKRDLERKFHQQNLFANKRRLRDYRRVRNSQNDIAFSKTSGLFGSSGKVVLTAVAINGSNFVFKLAAWLYSGSHSMFSECIHSLADTINQLILAFGIHKSVQIADEIHPYGYSNMKYVSSLISGVGIFCVGTGLSIYHGITGLYNPAPAESYFWAFCILGGSLVSEGATLMVAINSIKKGAIAKGMTFMEYVLRGQEPSVNVVLLEDLAAVLGVTVAASCMGLTCVTGSHVPDAIGSIIIGGLLGAVASFIIYTNVAALVGRSISQEFLEKINTELESDVMIRAIHDVKGIDMGNCLVRYKAELDFDGRELAKAYLDSQNIHALLEEVQKFKTIDELEQFILKHSENIIDMMGGEIDRIEVKLRAKFPEIRHCDLEIL